MTYENILALLAFAFATSITPGPNNIMLMTSGANFGVAKTLPHMAGVSLGFAILALVGGTGLMQVLEVWPAMLTVLQVICIVFALYIAWRIATAPTTQNDAKPSSARPLRFIEAAAFQWVNPKAIAMALTTVTVYSQSKTLFMIALAALLFTCVNLPCICFWVLMGQQLRRWLNTGHRLRIFNVTMAVLLIASMAPVMLAMM